MNHRVTVGTKFAVTCAVLVAFTIVLGVVTLHSINDVDTDLQAIVTDSLPGVQAIGTAESDFQAFRGNAWKHLACPDPKLLPDIERRMEELKRNLQTTMQAYEKTIQKAEDRVLYEKVGPALERYFAAWEPAQRLSRESKGKEAFQLYMEKVDPAFTVARDALVALGNWNRTSGEANAKGADESSALARQLSWLVLVVAVVVGALLAFLIVRSTNRTLREIVSELRTGAEQVAGAADQVASSSQSLAQGSSEQAASLEETSASTEEINSMARRNSENSNVAARLMTESRQNFKQVNQLLELSIAAMNQITSQSDKISRIIKTIDEIAFQTNILALNAAVEAARAGSAGMGFAVVAEEVRTLAQRSAQAAKDTAGLIEESIAKSKDGKLKVDQVAAAIHAVTDQVTKVNQLVEEVHVGSQEQARGIDQIGKAITQMQQVTQQTAANAEEGAAAAEELNSQSDGMKHVVERLEALVGRMEHRGQARAARRLGNRTTALIEA